jgi:RNase P subunit RPR2
MRDETATRGGNRIGEYPSPVVTITCDRCGRRERYPLSAVIAAYGYDAAGPDVLRAETIDCEHRGVKLRHADPCTAV